MTTLKKYTAQKNFIICYVVDDERAIGFAVCDRNEERYTNHLFETAGKAIEWAESNFKGIDDGV